MSRDTVSRCLETSLHFGWLFGIPASMVAPSSPGSRPVPCGWPAASLDAGCGGAWGRRSGCRAGCGCRGLLGWAGWQSARLVVTGRVQDQLTDQVAGVAVDDPDVQVVDQKGDRGAGEAGAEADVVQPAVVAQGDGTPAVDLVGPDPVVGGDDRAGGDGFGAGGVGLRRGAAAERPVGADRVVVAGESVQLVLQPGGCGRRRLCGEPFLLGLGRVGRAARCQPWLVLFRPASLRTGRTRFRVSGSPVTTA
jgi:hypothetical protein